MDCPRGSDNKAAMAFNISVNSYLMAKGWKKIFYLIWWWYDECLKYFCNDMILEEENFYQNETCLKNEVNVAGK